jgi:hypothetical protein
MARVKLSLAEKSDSALLTFTQQHIAAMSGNASFHTPVPTATALLALYTNFESALEAADHAATTAKEKMVLKDMARVALEQGLTQRGNYVELTAAGDETKIRSTQLPIRETATLLGELPAPADFVATMGDQEGEIDLIWSRVQGAKSYLIQHSPYATPRVWSQAQVVTSSKVTVGGCTPGEMRVFRVAAVGTAGKGPWSEESVKMAPGV